MAAKQSVAITATGVALTIWPLRYNNKQQLEIGRCTTTTLRRGVMWMRQANSTLSHNSQLELGSFAIFAISLQISVGWEAGKGGEVWLVALESTTRAESRILCYTIFEFGNKRWIVHATLTATHRYFNYRQLQQQDKCNYNKACLEKVLCLRIAAPFSRLLAECES